MQRSRPKPERTASQKTILWQTELRRETHGQSRGGERQEAPCLPKSVHGEPQSGLGKSKLNLPLFFDERLNVCVADASLWQTTRRVVGPWVCANLDESTALGETGAEI